MAARASYVSLVACRAGVGRHDGCILGPTTAVQAERRDGPTPKRAPAARHRDDDDAGPRTSLVVVRGRGRRERRTAPRNGKSSGSATQHPSAELPLNPSQCVSGDRTLKVRAHGVSGGDIDVQVRRNG